MMCYVHRNRLNHEKTYFKFCCQIYPLDGNMKRLRPQSGNFLLFKVGIWKEKKCRAGHLSTVGVVRARAMVDLL